VAVKNLIEKGADKTVVDQYNFNAYGLALREDNIQLADYLLSFPNFAYFDAL
jgi:hypothetical protein